MTRLRRHENKMLHTKEKSGNGPDGEVLRRRVGLPDVVDHAALPGARVGGVALAVHVDPAVEAGEDGGHEGEGHDDVECLGCVGFGV